MSQQPLDGPELSPGEREVERVLAGLAPEETALSRDEMLFAAGRASVPRRRSAWAWRASCVALAAVAAWGALRPAQVVEKTVVVERTAPASPVREVPVARMDVSAADDGGGKRGSRGLAFENLPEESYLRVRNEYLAHGVLPTTRPPDGDRTEENPGSGDRPEDERGIPAWRFRRTLGGRS